MRWIAVVGQIATCLVVDEIFGIALPLEALGLCIAITAATNLAVAAAGKRMELAAPSVSLLLLVLDTAVLTLMLALTGGARNPFVIFYLLHVAIGALVLGPVGSGVVIMGCLGGCYLLFFGGGITPERGLSPVLISESLYLQGMAVALVICGASIAFFVGRLRRDCEKLDQALAEGREQVARRRHHAALETLAAGVAHELASPLATIAVASKELERRLQEKGADGDTVEDAILIRSEVGRCTHILNRLNGRAIREREAPAQPIPASLLGNRIRETLPSGSQGRIELVNFGEDFLLEWDPEVLAQAIGVLVRNAVDASPPEKRIMVRLDATNQSVRFLVQDQGHGIQPDDMGRLGDPFYTTKEPGEGMGLGLFLVRAFCDSVEGLLKINSQPGKGTEAILELPRQIQTSEVRS